jgi:hypothetical protein
MPRGINFSYAIRKSDSSFSGNDYFVAIKQSSNQTADDSFTIAISICGGGIYEVATSIEEGATLIGSLNLIGISTPRHSAKSQAREG